MFARYFLASAAALGVDYSVLLGLVAATELPSHLCAAFAYLSGAIVHYALARRYVFPPGWLHRRRLAEFTGFLISGLVGLSLTVGIVYLGSQLLQPVLVSKTIAVALSFLSNYAARRYLVFRVRGSSPG
ncbi:MAG: GtrA family protein [Burkholderiaceae bacterium]|nr:GtrA family protein [Burkholderiaceae bacterium]